VSKQFIRAIQPPATPKSIADMTDEEIDQYADTLATAWAPAFDEISQRQVDSDAKGMIR
jgi:hypothetical protein